MSVPMIEGGLGSADCASHREFGMSWFGCDDGDAGSQGAIIEPGTEQCSAEALGGDAVSVRVRDALDESVHAQATEIIGNSSCGILARLVSEQGSKMLADVLVGE